MTVKSPCIDKCKLDQNKEYCVGCYRTSEEITNWQTYSDLKKRNILRILKYRRLKLLYLLFILFFSSEALTNNKWIGKWIALDQWQSEFIIEIKEDGTAITDYGDGDEGNWSFVDGNVEIIWGSGKKDYIFNGVMGFQRLSNDRGSSVTTGLRKSLD